MGKPRLQTKPHISPLRSESVSVHVAALWFLFNLVGLLTYKGHYDKFLLAASMVFDVITIWTARKWV